MKKVMFTCLGNICRSPLAHTLFEKMAKQHGLDVQVDSSGIGAWHQGNLADPRMRKTAEDKGYKITHLAKQLTKKDLEEFDIIFSMAEDVSVSIIAHFDPLFKYQKKVVFFRNFDPLFPKENDVPDPYHGEDDGFEEVFNIVERTCEELVKRLKSQQTPFSL